MSAAATHEAKLVLSLLVGGEQMPHPGGAGVGGAKRAPRRRAGFFALTADRRPCRPGRGCRFERPGLIRAEDHLRVTGLGHHVAVAVGAGVQVLGPGLLGCVVRVLAGFPGFQALEGDALLAERSPRALVADVVGRPLGGQELRQLGQVPGEERQVVVSWPRSGDLLDLPPPGTSELRRAAAPVPRLRGIEPVGVEIVTSRTRSSLVQATFAIAATSMPCADGSTLWARRQVTTEPVPRRGSAAGAGPHHRRSHAPAVVRPPARSR